MSQFEFVFDILADSFDVWFELVGLSFGQNVVDKLEPVDGLVPFQELSDSFTGEWTDGVVVGRAAVVLWEQSSQKVVQVQRGELDQEAFSFFLC